MYLSTQFYLICRMSQMESDLVLIKIVAQNPVLLGKMKVEKFSFSKQLFVPDSNQLTSC